MSNDIILARSHRVYAARAEQLRANLAAIAGGRPYIDIRLHRAPNESDLSWNGSTDGAVPGRKRRAYLINDAGRIAGKINQYLFAKPVLRDGIDEAFEADTTTTGLSVSRFWENVSETFTGGQCVWLHADRGAPEMDAATRRPRARTIAQREAAGDRVYWSAYFPTDVVDWSFDAQGRMLWVLTVEDYYRNDDPFAEPVEVKARMLWRAAATGATWERWEADARGKATQTGSGAISMPDVPFVALGTPSASPWWFDDVEMVQAALLNLSSLHHENLVKTVYPQLIIPQVMAEGLEAKIVERLGLQNGAHVAELVRELVRGLDRPFVEDAEHSGITRYLTPSAADLSAIPTEEDRRRRALFDMVGLALFNRESRQVQSAESKQFDHLDTEATLRNRALLLQDAETKLVALSARLDSTFSKYSPIWPQDFDVPSTAEDVAALTQLANMAEIPPTMARAVLKAGVKLLDSIERITPEDRKAILDEIEALGGDNGGSNLNAEVGKVPLAVQQLALARERATAGGDTALASQIGVRIEALLETLE